MKINGLRGMNRVSRLGRLGDAFSIDPFGNSIVIGDSPVPIDASAPTNITMPGQWPNTGPATVSVDAETRAILGLDPTAPPVSFPMTGAATPSAKDSPSLLDTWANKALDIGKQIMAVKQINDLTDINVQRAKAGLPPLSMSAIAPTVNVGVSPQTQQLLIYALLGGAAYLALSRR